MSVKLFLNLLPSENKGARTGAPPPLGSAPDSGWAEDSQPTWKLFTIEPSAVTCSQEWFCVGLLLQQTINKMTRIAKVSSLSIFWSHFCETGGPLSKLHTFGRRSLLSSFFVKLCCAFIIAVVVWHFHPGSIDRSLTYAARDRFRPTCKNLNLRCVTKLHKQ